MKQCTGGSRDDVSAPMGRGRPSAGSHSATAIRFGRAYFVEGGSYAKFGDRDEAARRLARWFAAIIRQWRRFGCDIGALQHPIVELGSGYGALLVMLAESGRSVIGTDVSQFSLAEIRKTEPLLPLVTADAEQLPFGDASVGTVVATDVLEHLFAPQAALEEIVRVLKPGGIALITTPNPLGDLLPGADSDRDSTHVSVSRPEQWRRRCAAAGLDVLVVKTGFQLPVAHRVSSMFSWVVALPRLGPLTILIVRRPPDLRP